MNGNTTITKRMVNDDKIRAEISAYISEHSTRDFEYSSHDEEIAAIEDWLSAGEFPCTLAQAVRDWNSD